MQISPGAGRLLARQRRPAAPRDGQEEGRGDGQGEGRLPRRRQAEGRRRQGRRARLRPDGEVRRLRLQPKSHSAAYGLITYQTAYLKRHYPRRVHGGAADLRQGQHRQGREVHRRGAAIGIAVLRPDVNESDTDFSVVQGRRERQRQEGDPLRPRRGEGRRRGRGRGRQVAREQGGPFLSLFDFCERVDARKVNRKVLEALVKAGAFDGLAEQSDVTRARLFAAHRSARSSAPPRRSATATAARPPCSALFGGGGSGGGTGHGSMRRGQVPGRARLDAQGAARLREGVARLLHQRPPARSLRRRDPPLHDRDLRQLHGEGRARGGDPGRRRQRADRAPHEERHGQDRLLQPGGSDRARSSSSSTRASSRSTASCCRATSRCW